MIKLLKILPDSKLWILNIAVGLIAIHLTLVAKNAPTFFLGTSSLFWLAIISQLWEKRHTLSLNSGVFSRFFGIAIIILLLVKSLSLTGYDPLLRIFPLIAGFGLSLIASGMKRLNQYSQELILFIVLAIPPELIAEPINQLIGVSALTGKFSSLILWHLGYEVFARGDFIIQPKGTIWISPECAGLATLLWLLQLSALFLIMFPLELGKKFLLPIIAVIIGFTINGFRIAYLSVLAFSNPAAFNYWHSQNSQIFSLLSVFLIGLFCLWLIKQEESEEESEDEEIRT